MGLQLFVGGLGGPELVIVLMLAVLLFGASKLPKLARASGEAMGEFQKGRETLEEDIEAATDGTSTDDASTDADPAADSGEPAVDADADADSGEPAVDADADSA